MEQTLFYGEEVGRAELGQVKNGNMDMLLIFEEELVLGEVGIFL